LRIMLAICDNMLKSIRLRLILVNQNTWSFCLEVVGVYLIL